MRDATSIALPCHSRAAGAADAGAVESVKNVGVAALVEGCTALLPHRPNILPYTPAGRRSALPVVQTLHVVPNADAPRPVPGTNGICSEEELRLDSTTRRATECGSILCDLSQGMELACSLHSRGCCQALLHEEA